MKSSTLSVNNNNPLSIETLFYRAELNLLPNVNIVEWLIFHIFSFFFFFRASGWMGADR
jgi:hypothetical protein